MADASEESWATVSPPRFISLSESLKGQFWDRCCLLSIPLPFVAWFLNAQFRMISMLLVVNYMCPSHQMTNYSTEQFTIMSVLGLRFSWANWSWTQTKQFLLIRNERRRSKYLSMFPIELFDVETNSTKSLWNLQIIFDKNFIFHSHISVVCKSCFYHTMDRSAKYSPSPRYG